MDCHPRVVCPAIVKQIADTVREDVRVDVTRATALSEAAVVIAEELHDAESVARALRAKGNVLWVKGQCKRAVRPLERAVGLFCQQHGMPLLVDQANYNIAHLHYLRGD